MKTIILIFALFSLNFSLGADLHSLNKLFSQNYNTLYEARMCAKNVERFVSLSLQHKINLENTYILKVTGSGFLETSGFYTRQNPNHWKMLGYFHYVFVADGYVFDFDLDEPLVLPLQDYIRLQFTPPYEPYYALGNVEFKIASLKFWKAQKFSVHDFINKTISTDLITFEQLVRITTLKKLKRIR